MIQAGIALLLKAAVLEKQLHHLRPRHARRVILHYPAEIRHVERPAADHYRIATGHRHALPGALPVPDLAVGDHRDGQPAANIADRLPVDALGPVAILFGAPVDRDFRGPACCTASAISNWRSPLSQPRRTFTVTGSEAGTASRIAFAAR